jgi:hypothetical protein
MQAGFARLIGGAAGAVMVASIFSATASAGCYDPWSAGGATPVLGAMCGDIQVSGSGDGDPINFVLNKPTPTVGFSNVSISGGGGANGIGSLVSVSGNHGTGHISAVSTISAPQNGSHSWSVSSRGYLGSYDTFTVGAQSLSAQVTSSLSGTFFGVGTGDSIFRLQDLGSSAQYTLSVFAWELNPDSTQTMLVSLEAGHSYRTYWSMKATADARVDFFNNRPNVTADLSGTGHLFIDVLTPGGSIAFDSGYDYRTAAVTPVPATLPLFLSALGGLGLVAYRRKKAIRRTA